MTRRGDTLMFDAPPTVAAWAAAGGKKESEEELKGMILQSFKAMKFIGLT